MDALQGEVGGLAGIPGLGALFGETPLLHISPQQYGEIANMQNLAGSINPATKMGEKSLESFLGTPGTPSSATQAALKEFTNLQAPGIESQAASMGLGNSGAALDALAQGQEQALVPFMQQDLSNTLSASNALGQLGQSQQSLQAGLVNQAYNMLGAQNRSIYDQAMNQWNLGTGVDKQMLGLLGNLFGSKQSSSSSGMDWGSLLGSLFG